MALIARNCSYVPLPFPSLIQAIIVLELSSRNDPTEGSLYSSRHFVHFPWFLVFSPSIRGFPSSVVNLPSRILPLIPSPPPSPFFPFHRIYSFFSFPSRPSHLNDRLCQSKLKPAFVYLIPRYKYRQTGYRWLLGAATTFLRIRARRDGDGESEIRSGARGERTKRERERKKERERGSVLRSVARGEDEGDSLRSENSLVTMNGPNESREPIKDYSRRCSANGIKR